MNLYYIANTNIILLEFSNECLLYYKKNKYKFDINPSTWKNILTKIRSQNNN